MDWYTTVLSKGAASPPQRPSPHASTPFHHHETNGQIFFKLLATTLRYVIHNILYYHKKFHESRHAGPVPNKQSARAKTETPERTNSSPAQRGSIDRAFVPKLHRHPKLGHFRHIRMRSEGRIEHAQMNAHSKRKLFQKIINKYMMQLTFLSCRSPSYIFLFSYLSSSSFSSYLPLF